jgi:phospholipid/cholesterol/gamma-HCH transport system ATP-binding protein
MRIELQQVSMEFQGQTLLHGIDLVIAPGTSVAILGPSGSGVSLLLKTAAGLLDPDAGQVLYDGRDLGGMPDRERRHLQTQTGFMFQDAALWANTNLEGNLLLPLRAAQPNKKPKELRTRMAAELERLRFKQDLRLRPDRLSFGQRRFVSFLRAILPGPRVLFLDEPHAGMDSHWVRTLSGEIKRLHRDGATLVMGGHRAGDWLPLAEKLLVLNEGRVAFTGTLAEARASRDPLLTDLLAGAGTADEHESTNPPEVKPW